MPDCEGMAQPCVDPASVLEATFPVIDEEIGNVEEPQPNFDEMEQMEEAKELILDQSPPPEVDEDPAEKMDNLTEIAFAEDIADDIIYFEDNHAYADKLIRQLLERVSIFEENLFRKGDKQYLFIHKRKWPYCREPNCARRIRRFRSRFHLLTHRVENHSETGLRVNMCGNCGYMNDTPYKLRKHLNKKSTCKSRTTIFFGNLRTKGPPKLRGG